MSEDKKEQGKREDIPSEEPRQQDHSKNSGEVSSGDSEAVKAKAETSPPPESEQDKIMKPLAGENAASPPPRAARSTRNQAESPKPEASEQKTASEPSDSAPKEGKVQAAEDREAKLKRAAEARAARAEAKAKKEEAEVPKEPSPMQPLLDKSVQWIRDKVSHEAVEDAFINELDGHRPYIFIKSDYWAETAKFVRDHEHFQLNYLRNVAGIDQETHMEVAYHLISLNTKQEFLFKVKTDREQPAVPSVTSVWQGANWQEREIYDLLGIDFPGHPDLRRIMMPDDWVGHPLRKDYEPIDPEV
ncbi:MULTISPECIES: NADH-quinone oxidoreductase subunit C [Paenibacillus]|uniref:NADH-quinone oxidoreductase subunit C n=1 Tax=Paenibacillus residui TaxID=629724 RepID=A0ABW3DEE6_9BACL